MLKACQMHLWEACETGDVAEVKRCLAEGATLHEKNRFGWTALHRACMGGSAECVSLVLPQDEKARAACIAQPDTEGNAPLHIAAGCAHAAVVSLLLREGAEVHKRKGTADEMKEGGATPMHTACKALAGTIKEDPAQIDAVRQERLIDAIIALLSGGGLLEAPDQRGNMAASFLPKPMLLRLLARVRNEGGVGHEAPPPQPSPPEEAPPPVAPAPPVGESGVVV